MRSSNGAHPVVPKQGCIMFRSTILFVVGLICYWISWLMAIRADSLPIESENQIMFFATAGPLFFIGAVASVITSLVMAVIFFSKRD